MGSVQATTQQQQTSAFANSLSGESNNSIGGMNDFLLLLTTQLKSQDPLNPQDSTEFVAQLASFSAVEQQLNTNANLETLIEKISGNEIQNLASYIGLSVTAPGAGFRYENTPIELDVPGQVTADSVMVEIKDANAQVVRVLPASPEGGKVTWNGKNSDNEDVPEGLYTATFVYNTKVDGEDVVTRVPSEGSGAVTQARMEGERTILKLDTGAEIDSDSITSVGS